MSKVAALPRRCLLKCDRNVIITIECPTQKEKFNSVQSKHDNFG